MEPREKKNLTCGHLNYTSNHHLLCLSQFFIIIATKTIPNKKRVATCVHTKSVAGASFLFFSSSFFDHTKKGKLSFYFFWSHVSFLKEKRTRHLFTNKREKFSTRKKKFHFFLSFYSFLVSFFFICRDKSAEKKEKGYLMLRPSYPKQTCLLEAISSFSSHLLCYCISSGISM